MDALADLVSGLLIERMGLADCWFEPFPFDTQLPRIEPGRIVLPAAEPGLEPWTLDAGVELPVLYRDLTVGRFVLLPRTRTSGVAFDADVRADAIALTLPVGAAVAAELCQIGDGFPSRG
jgi:hypothetical protein